MKKSLNPCVLVLGWARAAKQAFQPDGLLRQSE